MCWCLNGTTGAHTVSITDQKTLFIFTPCVRPSPPGRSTFLMTQLSFGPSAVSRELSSPSSFSLQFPSAGEAAPTKLRHPKHLVIRKERVFPKTAAIESVVRQYPVLTPVWHLAPAFELGGSLQGNMESSIATAASFRNSSSCSSVCDMKKAGGSGGGALRSGGEGCYEDAYDDDAGNEDWLIDSMVVGDGKDVGNFKLQNGLWYASANGARDISSYHLVDVDSITMPDYGRRVVSFTTVNLSTTSTLPPFNLERRSLNGDMSEIILKRAKLFCLQDLGVALITGGPGARVENGSLQEFYTVEIEVPLVRSDILDCVLASVANGVGCLIGTESGVSVCDKLLGVTVHLRNLKQIVPVVCQLGLKLHLRRPAQRK